LRMDLRRVKTGNHSAENAAADSGQSSPDCGSTGLRTRGHPYQRRRVSLIGWCRLDRRTE